MSNMNMDPKTLDPAATGGQRPSITRACIYWSYGTPGGEFTPEPRAATITGIPKFLKGAPHVKAGDNDGTVVSLFIPNPTGLFFQTETPYSDEPKPGHWSWPERV